MKKVFLIDKDSFSKHWVCEVFSTGYHNGARCTPKSPHPDWNCGWRHVFAQKASIETLEYTESFTPNYFESTFYQENYLRNLAKAANVYEIFCTYYPEQLIAIVD